MRWHRRSFSFVAGGAAAIILLVAACTSASFEVDPKVEVGLNRYAHGTAEEERDYLLYVPEEYLEAPAEPWPLVLYLHGYVSGSTDLDWLESQDVPSVVRHRPYRFIMAAPYAPISDFHNPEWAWLHRADYLKTLVDHVGEMVRIDTERVYLVGGSWGATGVWALASAYPELPAAVVTVSGGWSDRCPGCDWSGDVSWSYPDNICELSDIPAWIFHGNLDRRVPVGASQAVAAALSECGGEVRLDIEEGRGHDLRVFWPDIFAWLLDQGHDGDWPPLAG